MEYNSQRDKLKISEYGRNIQKMIDYAVSIPDRQTRTRTAYAIVGIMSQINPATKDTDDYQRTIWDHMHIISGFKLDVDGPYPAPTQEELFKKPEKIPYSDGKIRYRHYGKNIEAIIQKAVEYEPGPEKDALIHTIANHLKKSYLNWNRDSVSDDTILDHMAELSENKLSLKEELNLTATSDILSRNKQKKKKPAQKSGGGRRRGHSGRRF